MTYPERYAESVPPIDAREEALGLRMVGWTLLVHDALCVAFFAPASARDGSRLFTLWSVAEGLAGLALVVVGNLKEERARAAEKSAVPDRKRPEGRPGRAA